MQDQKKFLLSKCTNMDKNLCNDCIRCQLIKPNPNQKQLAEKEDFRGQSLFFNHRISFDTK